MKVVCKCGAEATLNPTEEAMFRELFKKHNAGKEPPEVNEGHCPEHRDTDDANFIDMKDVVRTN